MKSRTSGTGIFDRLKTSSNPPNRISLALNLLLGPNPNSVIKKAGGNTFNATSAWFIWYAR